MTLSVMAAVAVACLVGGVIGGATGFGYALVTVPVISALVDPATAIAIGLLVGSGCSVLLGAQQRGSFQTRPASWLLITAMLAMPLGLLVAGFVDIATLRILIGVVVLSLTMLLLTGWTFARPRRGLVVAGAAAGVLSTSTGMNGPPVVMACQGLDLRPRELRATSAGVIGIQGLLAAAVSGMSGFFDGDAMRAVAVSVVPTAVGWFLGARAFARFSPTTTRGVTWVLLVASGLLSIWTGVRS